MEKMSNKDDADISNNIDRIDREVERNNKVNDKAALLLKAQEYGKKMIDALNKCVSPFHFTEWAKTTLITDGGFEQIFEEKFWTLQPGKSYFLIRNHSSILLILVGKKVNLKETSFSVIGGHTDSPTIRFAPNSYTVDNTYEKFYIQAYGGGQWQTWFDRDLGLCGKVVIKNEETKKLETKLFNINEPILFIPNLCIHLRKDKDGGFNWNNEVHLRALTGSTFFDEEEDKLKEGDSMIEKKIGKKLAKLIADQLQVKTENIYDTNLIMYDLNEAKLTGIKKEFISSARFDNLGTSISSIFSAIEASKKLEDNSNINVLSLFDSEEIGSQTFQGAMSTFFRDTIYRVFSCLNLEDTIKEKDLFNYFQAACARSLVLSCDMGHLFHPNYPEYYHDKHRPLPNLGPVLKININARYSTECEGSSVIKYLGNKNKIPIQEFIVRQDSPCGTTIGPIIAGKCGMRTVDIGCCQLAMHSIREQTACLDLLYLKDLFTSYIVDFNEAIGDVYK